MPLIMPIKELRNTTEISNIAHKEQEPIFITKNGYSDLVVMSSELYDKFTKTNQALKAGCDLVIELPFMYTLERADIFASNAVDFLNLVKASSSNLVFLSLSNSSFNSFLKVSMFSRLTSAVKVIT